MRPRTLVAGLALAAIASSASPASLPPRIHALVGARVVVAPGKVLENATVIIRDGLISAVGTSETPPADARIWDLSGRTVYAGLIDASVALSDVNGAARPTPTPAAAGPPRGGPTADNPWPPPEGFVPSRRAADALKPSSKFLETYRALGFTAVQVVPDDGVLRGRAAALALGDGSPERNLLAADLAQVIRLENRGGNYPSSLMGSIAVVRQAFDDARWYVAAREAYKRKPAANERPPEDSNLAALAAASRGQAPVLFEGSGPLLLDRVKRLQEEFGLDAYALSTGSEWRRPGLAKAAGVSLVVPVAFPEAPKLEDDDDWADVSLAELRAWWYAPSNPRWLAEAEIPFALTTRGLKDPKRFPDQLRRALARGLPPERALAALTTEPARLLGLGDRLGTLEKGKIANLVVATGDLFAKSTRLETVWVDGQPYPQPPAKAKPDLSGNWTLGLALPDGRRELAVEIKRGQDKLLTSLSVVPEGHELSAAVTKAENGLNLTLDGTALGLAEAVTLRLAFDETRDILDGRFETKGGLSGSVSGARRETAEDQEIDRPEQPPAHDGGALDAPAAVLVHGATVWTAGGAGVLDGADLLVADGKVVAVGHDLVAPPGALVIDARGKHVTPGLVDCHSHIAIEGDVNEATLAVTSMVRIEDVVDSEDLDLYHDLAGGLTTANLLHGSANPIGGQNAVIKLRWGALPADLKLDGAPPGIKFALGENVKQSNWGEQFVLRYPQTRMGVAEVVRSAFLEARDYKRRRDAYEAGAKRKDEAPPRRDLRLDALVEILDGKRLVHAHSYRQDEILMLIREANDLGFHVATFQHVLEGYKVADDIARHGAGASTFSDWWDYKFEVYDAIPYNGALMWDRGVLVSYNSDSAEQARRLNYEAAKAVKYGGVPEAEALKFVTLNPAQQLGLGARIGSLEPGKDGDFVIWSGKPLSASSVALETWIDGKRYFSRARDLELREAVTREHDALVARARAAAKRAGTGVEASPKPAPGTADETQDRSRP